MRLLTRTPTCAALFAMIALVACGNNPSDSAQLLKILPDRIIGGDAEPTNVTAEQMANALQATANPVTLMDAETRGGQFLVVEIERNGAYRTYAASSRQSLTFRDGMIVATRGFGGDLMSSEEEALVGMVLAGSTGTVPYVQRFLTTDDQTVTRNFACNVSQGAAVPTAPAVPGARGRTVTATCSGDGAAFENVFVVESGRIIGARQWLGESVGYMIARPLRP